MRCLCELPILGSQSECTACGNIYRLPKTTGIKINLIGWYGERNLGDESFASVFRQAFSGHELIFSQKPVLEADAFILGGGGVIDYGYFDGLERVTHKPMYALGVDIPLCGDKYETLVKRTPFRKILIRSKEYFWIAREQGLKNVGYIPDLAFWNPPLSRRSYDKPRLGVSLINHLLGKSEHGLGHLNRALYRKRDLCDIKFLVFKPEDEVVIRKVIDLDPFPCEILKPATPEEMLAIISDLSVLLTMRFHGAIFANICRVPFIGLSTPGKHSLFCEQEGLHDSFMDFRDMNEYKLLTALNRMMSYSFRGDPDANRDLVVKELSQVRFEIERLVD